MDSELFSIAEAHILGLGAAETAGSFDGRELPEALPVKATPAIDVFHQLHHPGVFMLATAVSTDGQ